MAIRSVGKKNDLYVGHYTWDTPVQRGDGLREEPDREYKVNATMKSGLNPAEDAIWGRHIDILV